MTTAHFCSPPPAAKFSDKVGRGIPAPFKVKE